MLYARGLTVLLVFPDSLSAKNFLDEKRISWLVWFGTLHVWDGNLVHHLRLAWLTIRGIPLHLWDATVVDL